MNAVFYPAVFHPEETGYSVTVPDIEGCFTQGDTMDEAVRDGTGCHRPDAGRVRCLPHSFRSFLSSGWRPETLWSWSPLIWLLTKSSSALLKRPSPSPLGSMMQPRPHTSTSPAFFRTP